MQARMPPASTSPPHDPDQPEPPLHKAAAEVLKTARRQLAAHLELFTLEVRYSGLMLGSAAAMALLAALAVFSLWGLVLAATAAALLSAGWSWAAVLATLAVFNGLLVLVALWLMARSLRRVGIDSTRESLGLGGSHVPE